MKLRTLVGIATLSLLSTSAAVQPSPLRNTQGQGGAPSFGSTGSHLFSSSSFRPLTSYCNYACNRDNGASDDPLLPSCTPARESNGAIQDCKATTCGSSQDDIPFSLPWNQGDFPMLIPKSDPYNHAGHLVKTNGGVPQRANVTLHLEKLKMQLGKHVPDVNYTGNGVLDFEAWSPIWEDNVEPGYQWNWHFYQNYSMQLTKEDHPTWSEEEIYNASKSEFENAGAQFFAVTLDTLHRLRPNMKWGFYGFPKIYWGDCAGGTTEECGYNNPTLGPQRRSNNDGIAAVWASSGALFPAVYLLPQNPAWSNHTYHMLVVGSIKAIVAESQRLLTTFSNNNTSSNSSSSASNASSSITRPILPYHWPFYSNSDKKNLRPVSAEDLTRVLEGAWLPPHSTGIVIWAWEGFQYSDLKHAIDNVTMPTIAAAAAKATECSAQRCAGHGWCSELADDGTTIIEGSSSSSSSCVCLPGFSVALNCSR